MASNKQINLTPKKISSLLMILIAFFTLIILIFISIFLYRNFYQTIAQTKEILILREKVVINAVDMEKFNLIIEKLTKKVQPQKLDSLINPFR